jgi:ureidoglycolate lyase
MSGRRVEVRALTPQAFAAFGDVIDVGEQSGRTINRGTTQRYDDLTRLDVQESGGHPILSIFRAQAQQLPLTVRVLERHPLSSQSFYPLERRVFLVIVAEPVEQPRASHIHAFISNGHQGINYRRNTWHHALIALHETTDFLVIERGGPGENCIEVVPGDETIVVGPPV